MLDSAQPQILHLYASPSHNADIHSRCLDAPSAFQPAYSAAGTAPWRPQKMRLLSVDRHGLHMLFTSRREHDIEDCMTLHIPKACIVNMQSDIIDKDIAIYIRNRLHQDTRLQKWAKNEALRDEIQQKLTQDAHGMFRWAACQLDELSKCVNRAMLRKVLASLPSTLEATYEGILSRIHSEVAGYARKILLWLAFSQRPLTLDEVAEAVAIDPNREPPYDHDEKLEDSRDFLYICSSLVTIGGIPDPHANRILRKNATVPGVMLAHSTVKDYLISRQVASGRLANFFLDSTMSQVFITKCCLHYLLQFDNFQIIEGKNLQQFKLFGYSASEWIAHTKNLLEQDEAVNELILKLFGAEDGPYRTWLILHDPESPWVQSDFERSELEFASPLYYAARFGLCSVTKQLLSLQRFDVNAKGGVFDTALQAACAGGFDESVRYLLDAGADIGEMGGKHGSAMRAAVTNGHERIVELLLKKGTQDFSDPEDLAKSLHNASAFGHLGTVRLLLDTGFYDEHIINQALWWAVERDHESVVQLLVERGADVNDRRDTQSIRTPLQAAVTSLHFRTVQTLLENGAEINAQGGYEGTALQAAAQRGNAPLVVLLLEYGADVNIQNEHGDHPNALYAASDQRHWPISQILREHGGYYEIEDIIDDDDKSYDRPGTPAFYGPLLTPLPDSDDEAPPFDYRSSYGLDSRPLLDSDDSASESDDLLNSPDSLRSFHRSLN